MSEEWFDVKVKVPDDHCYCIVRFEEGYERRAVYWKDGCIPKYLRTLLAPKNFFYEYDNDKTQYGIDHLITHWRKRTKGDDEKYGPT